MTYVPFSTIRTSQLEMRYPLCAVGRDTVSGLPARVRSPQPATSMGNKDELDTKFLGVLLKRHYHDVKPVEIVSTTVDRAVPDGENFTSCVRRVQLNCILASGKIKKISMIVKTELSGKAQELFSIYQLFAMEINVYTTILPLMEDLMVEFGDNRENLWPRIYGFKAYSLVCFEDLSEQGYVQSRRKTPLDLNHALMVLRGIARFHAMSRVLLSRGLIIRENTGEFFDEHELEKKEWNAVLSVLCTSMANDWGDEWSEIRRKLENVKDSVPNRLLELSEDCDKRFEVLNHGDLWTSNVMFRYMEFEGIPVSVRLIDFQICHVNSFIWDVENFLSIAVDPVVRREQKHSLLAAYQIALEKNLNVFNYTGHIPSLDDVISESKRIEFAQAMLIAYQPIVIANVTIPYDQEKIMTHPPEEVIDRSVYSDGKAMEAIGVDLKHFAQIGVI